LYYTNKAANIVKAVFALVPSIKLFYIQPAHYKLCSTWAIRFTWMRPSQYWL